jgi:hypothetical protein
MEKQKLAAYAIGITGLFLSAVSYMMYIPEAVEQVSTVLGMILVSCGYILLLIDQIFGVYINSLKEKKKTDDVKDLQKTSKIINVLGYILLAIFFFLIHLMPEFTFRIRFYDVFAAIGYFVAIFTKFGMVPLWSAYMPLIVYYLLAGSIKVFETGIIEKIQLIARLLLAAYYTLSLYYVAVD